MNGYQAEVGSIVQSADGNYHEVLNNKHMFVLTVAPLHHKTRVIYYGGYQPFCVAKSDVVVVEKQKAKIIKFLEYLTKNWEI